MTKVGQDSIPALNKMWAWESSFYGEPHRTLKYNPAAPMPTIKWSTQIIVKVLACSVSPFDVRLMRGFGSKMMQSLRQKEESGNKLCCVKKNAKEFPLILGRDIAGIVTQRGGAVRRFEIGDHVYGFVPFEDAGGQAEFCLVDRDWMQPKPVAMSFTEAASISFAAMTTWTSLRGVGKISEFKDKNFLVLGGSGSVGTFAIQYLKCKEAKVTTTCNPDSFTLMNTIAADYTVDYAAPDHLKSIESHGPYDCILDLSGKDGPPRVLLQWIKNESGSQYITVTTPAVENMNNHGLFWGKVKNKLDLMHANMGPCFGQQIAIKWGSFSSSRAGWKEMAELVLEGKIKPVLDKTFQFTELPLAYQRVTKGHLRGKVVVETKY